MAIAEVPTGRISVAQAYLQSRNDVAFAYLFGSTAKGSSNPLSDVDIAVYLTKGPFSKKRLQILGDLIDIFHTDHIDLIILNTASEGLKARIIRDRKVLVDNRPFHRHRFESQTIRAYLDFSKIENRILEQRYFNG